MYSVFVPWYPTLCPVVPLAWGTMGRKSCLFYFDLFLYVRIISITCCLGMIEKEVVNLCSKVQYCGKVNKNVIPKIVFFVPWSPTLPYANSSCQTGLKFWWTCVVIWGLEILQTRTWLKHFSKGLRLDSNPLVKILKAFDLS